MIYTDKTDAQNRVYSLIDYDFADPTKEDEISEYLDITAGIKQTSQLVEGVEETVPVIHYRLFLVAAIILCQDLDQQAIEESNKTVFTGLTRPIRSLFQFQKAYDRLHKLEIPEGFTVDEFLDSLLEEPSSGMTIATI